MGFYQDLLDSTEEGRRYIVEAPIICRCLSGDVDLESYVAFLAQAYHHVKHTTPLLMTTGGRLSADKEWLREAVAAYIDEELGHQEWVLNDIAACGFDPEKVRQAAPNSSTELMVAYAYDLVARINPLGFFGMVQVLEGTSIGIASLAVDKIQRALGLPDAAFSYLRSHGVLDQSHVTLFASLMNRIEDPGEQELIIHSARMFYQLYGNVFRQLDPAQAAMFKARDVQTARRPPWS